MKKFIYTTLKIIIFFFVWAVCISIYIDIASDNPAIKRLWYEFLPFIITVVLSIVVWLIEKRKIKIISFQKPTMNILVGVSTGIVWLGLAVIVMYLLGTISFTSSNKVDYLYIWILACFLNVIMQELLVRGYIYQLIKSKYNVVAAIISTTTLFTALHAGAFEAGIIAVANVVTMSVFVSLVLEYTESLIAPIIIHTTWNAVGAIVLGSISLSSDYPHLLNTVFSGNELLSGGNCKIEGSVIVLVLNVIFAFAFFIMIKRRTSNTAK